LGEVGLSGEIRQVPQADARLKEAARLGFGVGALPRRIARGRAAWCSRRTDRGGIM
jgi:DNA repair protein RadA/Sms